jgi:hypothetical protein
MHESGAVYEPVRKSFSILVHRFRQIYGMSCSFVGRNPGDYRCVIMVI